MFTPPTHLTRAGDLYQVFAARVLKSLESRFWWADPQRLADAVLDSLLDLALTTAEVTELMVLSRATERARTLNRSEARLKAREKKVCTPVTKSSPAVLNVLDEIADREQMRLYRDQIAGTPLERELLELRLNGYTKPAEVAALTGRTESEVERVFARLRQRLFRVRRLVAANPQ